MENRDHTKLKFLGAGACIIFFSPTLVAAAEDKEDSWALEEIVVTARKRTESAQSVPIAMNVLTGKRLNALGVKDTDDIESLYPNLSSNNTSAVNSGFTIRGVGTNNFHISGQQSVGTNIDDVATISPFISAVSVYDMERVEVLRGPQNTLYGRNTTGGVINFYTRKADPEEGLNGFGNIATGSGGLLEFEGAIGFNLSDNIAVRIAGTASNYNGQFTNLVDGSALGQDDKYGGRFNLVWNVSENSKIDLTYSHGEAKGHGMIARSIGNLNADGATTCAAFATGGEQAFLQGRNECWTAISTKMIEGNSYLTAQRDAGNTNLLIANPNAATNGITPWLVNYSSEWGNSYSHTAASSYDAKFDSFQFKFSHDFETMQLTLLSAYDKNIVLNGTARDLSGFGAFQGGEFKALQNEIRLSSSTDSKLQWLAGLYYSTQDSIEDTWVMRTDPYVAGGNGVSPSILIDSEYDNFSAYGQLDYEISDTLTFSGGLRYSKDKLEGHTRKFVCTPGQHNGATFDGAIGYDRAYRLENCKDISASLVDQNPTQELSELGWKAGLSWQATEDMMAYGSVSRGFKGGAYDNRALDTGSSPIGPEYLTAYEVGLKSNLMDNRLQLNLAAYLYDWTGLQTFTVDSNGGPAQVNIPKTKLMGFEIETKWAATEFLYIEAGIGVSDSEITDITGVPLNIEKGNEVTNAPKMTFNLLALYTVELENSEIIFQGTYRHEGSSYFVITNQTSPGSKKDAHDWVNGRISYNFGDERQYGLAFWVDNITEEKSCQYKPSSLPGGVNWSCQISDPGVRVWGMSMEVNF